MRRIGAACMAGLIGLVALVGTVLPTAAQDVPPELGDVILEDPLSAPGVPAMFTCQTGRQKRELANDGLTFVVSGGCQTDGDFPGTGINVRNNLTVADGEVRVDFRQLSGLDRTQVQIFLRTRNQPSFNGYGATLTPTRGTLDLGVSTDEGFKMLGRRTDLASVLRVDDWNTFAVRARGQNFWIFLNDQMVLAASDASLDNGIANVVVRRSGQADAADTQEVSAVLRNLRVSAIAGGEQARMPVYTPPPPVVTASALPCSLPTAITNDVMMSAPAPNTDPSIAKLAGAWEGTWDEGKPGALPSRLYVEKFEPTKVTVVYTWGESAASNTSAGWGRIGADIQPEGKISWGTTRKFTFWAVDDNSLAGTLETAQFTTNITLSRCP
jgi:hypothetical protein